MADVTFSLSFTCNPGDLIEVWGHSPGVTTEDYEKDPSIDPYYIHDKYTISDVEPPWYWFVYDETRGYVASIYVNGVLAEHRSIDPIVLPSVTVKDVEAGYHTITIYFTDTSSSDNLHVYYYLDTNTTRSATITYYNDGTARAYFDDLIPGKNYAIYIDANGYTAFDKLYCYTDDYPTFEWSTTIESGAEMTVNWSTKEVSPITAIEWNRFLDIYGLKTGTTYTHVSKGDSLSVKSGTTMRKIADNLGVDVSVGEEITAQFFIELKNALNTLK
jgi:hypothetical protein